MFTSFSVIVTLGPAVKDAASLQAINAAGQCIYRINGSHYSDKNEVLDIAAYVRSILPNAQILLDLSGNKIRIANLWQPIVFKAGQSIKLSANQLNFKPFFNRLRVGDRIIANDGTYDFIIKSLRDETIEMEPHSDGVLLNKKGLHVSGCHKGIPFLFEQDIMLIEAGMEAGIDYLGLSFVRNPDDIREVKQVISKMEGFKPVLISKVETLAAVQTLDEILREVEFVLVDRGDLASDVGMMEMPRYHEYVIKRTQLFNKKVFLATQFLKNMETHPVPSIAEEIDLYNTLKKSIQGIQLSEETAIGKFPVACVSHVFEMHRKILEEGKLSQSLAPERDFAAFPFDSNP